MAHKRFALKARVALAVFSLALPLLVPFANVEAAVAVPLFSDTFGRATGNTVGNGWVEGLGSGSDENIDKAGIICQLLGANLAPSGNNFFELRGDSAGTNLVTVDAWASHVINTTNYENINLSFQRAVRGVTNSGGSQDKLIVQWRTDNLAAWTTLNESAVNAGGTGCNVINFTAQSLALPAGAANQPTLEIRFGIIGTSQNDRFLIDDVLVTGEAMAPVVLDSDHDGIPDSSDNCVVVSNADQSDIDHDTIGDACDSDIDNDGILNGEDNCQLVSNADQADFDHNGVGDVCENDTDGDLVADATDNCPADSNADQSDIDHDGIGDVCDSDVDGDTIANTPDNCPSISNADQSDIDHDGIGDVCDSDIDGDTVPNAADNCPLVSNIDQADLDNDGAGNACDTNTVTPAVVVTPSGASTDVSESGIIDTYDVVLTTKPTADVAITVTPNAQLSVTSTPLTFTDENWDQPQTVTVSAVDDSVVEGTHSGVITHSAVSDEGSAYDGISIDSVTASITDNDTAPESEEPPTPTPPTRGGGGGSPTIPALIIHDINVRRGSAPFSAVVTWLTNKPATSRVVYGTGSRPAPAGAPNYGYAFSTPTTDEGFDKVMTHSVIITGLQKGVRYFFRPISSASPEIYGSEVDLTFTDETAVTPPAPEPAPTPQPTTEPSASPAPAGTVAGISTAETPPAPEGQVAGVKIDERVAQNTTTTPPVVTTTETAPTETSPFDCTAYMWVVLILNLLATLALGYLTNSDSRMWVRYSWILAALVAIVPAVGWSTQCWVLLVEIGILIGLAITLATYWQTAKKSS